VVGIFLGHSQLLLGSKVDTRYQLRASEGSTEVEGVNPFG
jgi:hypothetical protein